MLHETVWQEVAYEIEIFKETWNDDFSNKTMNPETARNDHLLIENQSMAHSQQTLLFVCGRSLVYMVAGYMGGGGEGGRGV